MSNQTIFLDLGLFANYFQILISNYITPGIEKIKFKLVILAADLVLEIANCLLITLHYILPCVQY